jgi:hypothetical protein
VSQGIEQAGDLWTRFGGATDEARAKEKELEDAIENGRSGLFGFTGAVDDAAAGLEDAADAAAEFTGALAEMDSWLSKRAALRGYREDIQDLAKGLKDGFNRQDRENIDATAESILRVAEQIKSPKLREDFLKNARASLMELAQGAAPKARAEIEKVIGKLDEFGITKPKSPKLDVDTTAATNAISAIKSWLNGIPDEHVKVYVERVGSMGGPGRDPEISSPNQRTSRRTAGRASAVPTSLTFGRGMNDDKAALYGDMLGGSRGGPWAQVEDAAHGAAEGLRGLRRRLREAEAAVDRERRQRDALVARRDEVRNAIASDMGGDLFGVSQASGNVWAAGATAGGVMDPQAAVEARRERARRWIAALRTLKDKKVRPAAMQAIIAEGLEAAEFMAAQSSAYLSEFNATLAEAAQFTAQAQNIAGNAVVSVAEMNAANAELKAANKTLKAIEKAIERADKNNKDGHKGTQESTGGWARSVRAGHRRGKAYA